jgi:hypothetical protein
VKDRLRSDRDGDETLMPVFIFAATFIIIGALMIGLMQPLFASADRGEFNQLSNYEMIGSIGYLLYDPNDGYDLTSANVTDDGTTDIPLVFTNDSVSDRWVWAVRDYIYWEDIPANEDARPEFYNHQDFLAIWTEWGPWYNHHIRLLVVDYETVVSKQIVGLNQSAVPFSIAGTSEVLIITTPGNASEFETVLWSNNFNIRMGQPAFSTDVASTSMWAILGQLMTASLPNVHPIVNILITIPFNACLGFMVFTIVSRMIPWIAGG